jgi:hypothetical protein
MLLIVERVQGAFRECSSLNITRCTSEAKPADVLYLVDASDSMYPQFFYGQMLDYVLQLQCTLNDTLPNRVGMLLFSNRINKVIRLDQYTPQEFYDQVQAVRQDASACCTCCTPLVSVYLLPEKSLIYFIVLTNVMTYTRLKLLSLQRMSSLKGGKILRK